MGQKSKSVLFFPGFKIPSNLFFDMMYSGINSESNANDIKKYQKENESLLINENYTTTKKPTLFHDYKINNPNAEIFDNQYLQKINQLPVGALDAFGSFRENLCDQYSFAIPNIEVLTIIKKYVNSDFLFEIGAGSGYWAKLLNLLGIDIVCFDNFSWTWGNKYFPIHNIKNFQGKDLSRSKLFSNLNHLFICWPTFDSYDFEYLSAFKGEYFYYSGEIGGCCGTFEFFNLLNEKFKLIEEINIPQWRGIHDIFQVWKRI